MRLTTRKLVLRQIAHARGLMARAQEDPTYELPATWPAVSYCPTYQLPATWPAVSCIDYQLPGPL